MRRQHRFNLGTDKREAERRFAKLRDLYDENLGVYCSGEDELWSPLALSYAEKIAKGEYRISYPPLPADGGFTEPLLEYAQMVHTIRGWFPSLDLIPEDPALYEQSNRLNKQLTGEKLRGLEGELKDLGVLPTGRTLPEKLIAGSLHQALDDYESEINTHSLRPGSTELTPYGRLRLARVKRFRKAHDDIPLHDLNFDVCLGMIAHWKNRPLGVRGATSRDNARHHIGELLRMFRWLDTTEKYQWHRSYAVVIARLARAGGPGPLDCLL